MLTNVNGKWRLSMTVGDDYASADGRALSFTLDGTSLPDLTNGKCWLYLGVPGTGRRHVVISGEITTPTGDSRVVKFAPGNRQTSKLLPVIDGSFFIRLQTSGGTFLSPDDGRGCLTVLDGVEFNPLFAEDIGPC